MQHYDRTDWRSADTTQLIEAARDSGHELCIALGERLEECRHVEQLEIECEELHEVIHTMQRQMDNMQDEIRAYEYGYHS